MLTQNNKSFFILSTIITGIITLLDLGIIIMLLEATPVMQGYALSEALIFVKFAVFMTLFMIQLIFLLKSQGNLNKNKLTMLLVLSLVITVSYMLTMYVYKF